jgi:hypothetical protein
MNDLDKIVTQAALRIARTWRLAPGGLPYLKRIIKEAVQPQRSDFITGICDDINCPCKWRPVSPDPDAEGSEPQKWDWRGLVGMNEREAKALADSYNAELPAELKRAFSEGYSKALARSEALEHAEEFSDAWGILTEIRADLAQVKEGK